MIDKVVDAVSRIATNVYAFLLFVLAGLLAFAAHHVHDPDLTHFAETVATAGAALFHARDKA